MNNNQVRNFYEEEAQYEKSIFVIKDMIQKIINLKTEDLQSKIKYVDENSEYIEYIDLFEAVIGRKTNKYYWSQNEEDEKYYNLVLGQVYRTDKLNMELQVKNKEEKVLNLQARAILAQKLLPTTKNLKQIFSLNVGKTDNSFVTFDSYHIKEQDINYLDNFIKYLELMIDKTGRLKILDAEQDVYSVEKAKESYNKKSSLEKWIYKKLNKEQDIINNMSKKYK